MESTAEDPAAEETLSRSSVSDISLDGADWVGTYNDDSGEFPELPRERERVRPEPADGGETRVDSGRDWSMGIITSTVEGGGGIV